MFRTKSESIRHLAEKVLIGVKASDNVSKEIRDIDCTLKKLVNQTNRNDKWDKEKAEKDRERSLRIIDETQALFAEMNSIDLPPPAKRKEIVAANRKTWAMLFPEYQKFR